MTSGLITSLTKKQSYFLNENIRLSFTFSTKLDVYNIHITREQKTQTKTYLKKKQSFKSFEQYKLSVLMTEVKM